jgi:choline dehydrogenase
MYDFIIVGAGTAGCVLANRLTACGRLRVLLIEAGDRPTLPVRVPAAMTKLFKGPHDWAFQSEPQAGCGGRSIFIPRGRMLGGSSNLNAQIHQWGHPADFEAWAAEGATGWSWRDVAPVFKAMESWRGPGACESRGRAGPLRAERLRPTSPLTAAFIAAAKESGLASADDYNGRGDVVALAHVNHRGGRRYGAYDALLKPAMRRRNLTVLSGTPATRIVFRDRQAVGVTTCVAGREVKHCARQVVLAAGAIGTPHLLMVSGVGPAHELTSLGVRPVAHAPRLGRNLQDHPMSVLAFPTMGSSSLLGADSPFELIKWLALGRGRLSSNAVEALAFANTLACPAPDVELLFAPVEWRDEALSPPRVHAYSIGVGLLAPKSRGRIRLRSASPRCAPSIDLGLLSDPDGADARTLLRGLRLLRQLTASEALRRVTMPTPHPLDCSGDEALLALGKSTLQTIYHPAGTCRMGDDDDAPVTAGLRLRGVEGVWVADASVMPTLPRAHPNATIAMIAERAARAMLGGEM